MKRPGTGLVLRGALQRSAAGDAEDRQRALEDVCRRVLGGFVGRKITSMIVAEAEGAVRAALDDAVRAGKYVLPDGLELDRVELGANMRLQVYFKPAGLLPRAPEPEGDHDAMDPEPSETKMKDRFEAVAAEISSDEKEET